MATPAGPGRTTNPAGPGRALPAHVVAQLDAHLDLLRGVPGAVVRGRRSGVEQRRFLGVLGDHAGEVAVLAYLLLKGTGRRLGEVVSLRLDCLDVDEHGKPVLVYDNHKAGRTSRRLPIADSALVEAIRAQQRWVRDRFPTTPAKKLWLLPKPNRNSDGTGHISTEIIGMWMRRWVQAIPVIEAAPAVGDAQPTEADRSTITPHAFRHTYAQTLADQGCLAVGAAGPDGPPQHGHHARLLQPSGIASDGRGSAGRLLTRLWE